MNLHFQKIIKNVFTCLKHLITIFGKYQEKSYTGSIAILLFIKLLIYTIEIKVNFDNKTEK